MVTPDAKRKAVAHACTVHAVSQRRACLALTIDRSTVRYTSTRPDDALLREAMKAVAAERRRFGYRRIHIMLDRQGIVMNQKKLRRLYREEKLQVRRRGGRKRALGTRRPMLVPDRANARWSLDFLSDTISDGRRFRVLANRPHEQEAGGFEELLLEARPGGIQGFLGDLSGGTAGLVSLHGR